MSGQAGKERQPVDVADQGVGDGERDGHGRLDPQDRRDARAVAQAAARLYLSRATVASHVAHILAKLGFSAHTQIASWVTGRRDSAGDPEDAGAQ